MVFSTKNADYKVQIIVLPYYKGVRQKGSKSMTLYNTVPFNLNILENLIWSCLEKASDLSIESDKNLVSKHKEC